MKGFDDYNVEGGPAFGHGDWTNGGHAGMTLRDYLAGQALAGLCADETATENMSHEQIALWCFKQADAMLALRDQPKARPRVISYSKHPLGAFTLTMSDGSQIEFDPNQFRAGGG